MGMNSAPKPRPTMATRILRSRIMVRSLCLEIQHENTKERNHESKSESKVSYSNSVFVLLLFRAFVIDPDCGSSALGGPVLHARRIVASHPTGQRLFQLLDKFAPRPDRIAAGLACRLERGRVHVRAERHHPRHAWAAILQPRHQRADRQSR